MDSLVPKPYITADYASHNGMNGDNINDIYVDGGDRIWLANYPAGVTIRNNRYQSYEWFPPSCIPSDRLRKERHRPTAGCSRLIPLLVANHKSPSLSSMTSCT